MAPAGRSSAACVAGFIDLFQGRQLAGQAVEGRLIHLALTVGLIRLVVAAVQIAHHLGDRYGIAGIDLGFILLGAPAPHGTLRPAAALQRGQGAIHDLAGRELAQPGILRLIHGHA
jgi:hypothetical protein